MPIAVATMPGPAFVDPSEVIKHKANRIADNHMYELKVPAKLPVREAVGSFPKNVDPVVVAQTWLDSFKSELMRVEDSSVSDAFLPDGARGKQDSRLRFATNADCRPLLFRRLARPGHFHGRLSNNHRYRGDQCHGIGMFAPPLQVRSPVWTDADTLASLFSR